MKVLIADDHELIREGLAQTLSQEGIAAEILQARDRETVLTRLSENEDIDVILLDLLMPGADGYGLLSEVCNRDGHPPVIVISANEESHRMRKSIDHGASGYIPKSANREIMLSAIRLVKNGGTYIPPEMLQNNPAHKPNGSAQNNARRVSQDSMSDEFSHIRRKVTPRQQQVLELMAVGMSNKEIAHQLELSKNTVKIHVTGLLRLLGASNRTEAVIMAQNAGLI